MELLAGDDSIAVGVEILKDIHKLVFLLRGEELGDHEGVYNCFEFVLEFEGTDVVDYLFLFLWGWVLSGLLEPGMVIGLFSTDTLIRILLQQFLQ